MNAVRGVLVVIEERPGIAGMVDMLLEVGGERSKGRRNKADEVKFVHLRMVAIGRDPLGMYGVGMSG